MKHIKTYKLFESIEIHQREMKMKHKKRIAYEVAKEFWDNSSESLRYKMVYDYLKFIESTQSGQEGFVYKMSEKDYQGICKCNWKEIPLYQYDYPNDCPFPSDIRTSVCYYLGIGLYENRKSSDIQYQRKYKFKLLGK